MVSAIGGKEDTAEVNSSNTMYPSVQFSKQRMYTCMWKYVVVFTNVNLHIIFIYTSTVFGTMLKHICVILRPDIHNTNVEVIISLQFLKLFLIYKCTYM